MKANIKNYVINNLNFTIFISFKFQFMRKLQKQETKIDPFLIPVEYENLKTLQQSVVFLIYKIKYKTK